LWLGGKPSGRRHKLSDTQIHHLLVELKGNKNFTKKNTIFIYKHFGE
jgi:hypothetical protein